MMMSYPYLKLGDYTFITGNLCYKLEAWSLDDMGIYQARGVSGKYSIGGIMGNVGCSLPGACPY